MFWYLEMAKQCYTSQIGPAGTYWLFPRPSLSDPVHEPDLYVYNSAKYKCGYAGFLPTWGCLYLKNLSCPLGTNVHSFHRIGARHLILSIFYLEANMWGADTMDILLMFLSWGETKLSHLDCYLKVYINTLRFLIMTGMFWEVRKIKGS